MYQAPRYSMSTLQPWGPLKSGHIHHTVHLVIFQGALLRTAELQSISLKTRGKFYASAIFWDSQS